MGSSLLAVLDFFVDPGVIVELTSLLEVLVGLLIVLNPVVLDIVRLKFEVLGGGFDIINILRELSSAAVEVRGIVHLLVELVKLLSLELTIIRSLDASRLSVDFAAIIQSVVARSLQLLELGLGVSQTLKPLLTESLLLLL